MAEDTQGDLPIEEIGIDLVVNAGDNFIGDMSKAGKQMTTFSQQIGRLVNALPMLNIGLQDLSTQLANINNRTGNVKNLAQALNQLGKMPNTVKNVATNATNAATAVDKLYTSLEKAQTRMAGLRSEEAEMRLEMQRKRGASKGAESTGAVTGKGTKTTTRQATAQELAPRKFDVSPQAKSAVRELFAKNEELSLKVKLDLESGQLRKETADELLAAIQDASKTASTGSARKAFAAIGADHAEGLIVGLEKAKAGVTDAAASLAQQIIVTMRDVLKTHSAGEEGKDIGFDHGMGVAKGERKAVPEVEAAGEELGKAAMRGVEKGMGAASGQDMGASVAFMVTKKMQAQLNALGYKTSEINKMSPSEANRIIQGRIAKDDKAAATSGTAATPQAASSTAAATQQATTPAAASAQQAGKDAGKKIVEQASKGVEQGTQSAASELGPGIKRKAAKIADELKQIRTGQGPLNDRDFETESGMNQRLDAALQKRLKESDAVRKRANKIIDNNAEATAFLLSLDPEVRHALDSASKLRNVRKLTSNRGQNVLDQGAIDDALLAQMKLAGAEGTAPGTESLGSQKMRGAYVPALGKVARWKERRGGGVSMGHNAGKRDFTGALYQQKMQAYADQGGLEAAIANAKPGSPEWKALKENFSLVTSKFPWQPQDARVPKSFKGDKGRLEQATAAAAKVIIKAMGLDDQAPTIQTRRLAGKKGSAQFEALYNDMPEMQAFRDVGARDVKQYLREQLRVGIQKQRVVSKQGDPQIEQATSEYYKTAFDIIGRQDIGLGEIIDSLEKVNEQIRKDLRAKFEETGNQVYKMLSERDDPVMRRTIDYLKKFGERESATNPGQTIAEITDAWAGVWSFLKKKFGGQGEAMAALSEYEEYVNKIETPAMRNDLMPDFPRGLQVRRVRGAPRRIDKDLADKHSQDRLDAELAYRDQQHYKVSRIRNAIDARDVQGSRKLITQFEQQRMQAQIPEAPGVDREKVLEASNTAIAIEWELAAQEDTINKAAEAYAKKNGRTLEQVNQAVENVRTGKNKKPGKALTELAKMVAEYDKAITRWEAAIGAYLEKAIPAQQAASKSIGKGIAKGEFRVAGAKYFDAEGNRVSPEGIGIDPRAGANAGRNLVAEPSRFERAPKYGDVRTRNLTFMPGGLVRGADGKPQVFDTSVTKRQYQPEILGATAEAAYAPAYKKPRGFRAPELTDKARIARANRAAEIQAELGGMYNSKLDQTYGGFKPPTKKAFAGGDLEKASRIFGTYSRDFNELLRIKTTELSVDVKTALDSINTAANNYIGSAIKYVDSFRRSGFLEKGAAEKFNAELIGAQAQIIDLKNRVAAGEDIDPATVKTVVKALHERVKAMGMFMEQSTAGLNELEKAADKAVADAAAADKAKVVATQAGAWQAANAARTVNRQAAGWQAAQGGGQAQGAARAAGQAFTFPDDWVIRIVNAIGQAADKVVAAVRGIRIELTGGGVAENVGPTEAQKKAGRPKRTEAESVQGLANMQADLIRTSEVDAYRAAHTAMRQVRMANDLNPEEVKRLQAAIDAWRVAAIKNATDSIKMQANRGDVVDTFRASRSQADLDLQKIIGPEIRKTITNQEEAVTEREMRTLKTAFDDIARAERNVTTSLQKSGAPAQQIEQDLKAVAAAAELAREDVVRLSQESKSFQIFDAQVDQVVNGLREMGEQAKFAAAQASRTPLMQKELAIQTRKDSITRDAERLRSSVLGQANVVPPAELQRIVGQIDAVSGDAEKKLDALLATAQAGGVGAENSMAALNLELQKIRTNAAADIEVLRQLFAVTVQNARATAAANASAPKTSGGVSDVDRALGAGQRTFARASALGQRVLSEPYANKQAVADLLKQLADIKAQTQEAIDKALANPLNATGSEKANAVREAIQSTKADLDGITAKLHDIERASQGVTGSFQKIDHAVADVRGKIADLGAGGRARIDSTFASSLAINLDKTAASAVKKFEPTIANIKTRLTQMYTEARQAALAGDKAAVNQLVWEIRKLTDAAEAQVDASLNRILARADQIDRQVKGMQQIRDWAKDPQSFLQEQVVGKAKQGGLTGWFNRAKLNFQEADAVAEMFKSVQKAKFEINNLDVILRTLKNTVGGVFFGISGVFKLLSSPVWLPLKAGIAIFKGMSLAIDGVAGSFKKLRYMMALPGKKKEFAAGLNEDDRGQRYADVYAQYTALFEKMNRTQYNKATAGKKFFAAPGFDKGSLDRQAKDFGKLQSAYDKLQKSAVKQGIMDKPVTAVGRAASAATKPLVIMVDVMTLGASAAKREQKALNAEVARTGTTAQAAGVKVQRSGLFGAKRVSTQPRTATGQFDTFGVQQAAEPAKKKFNKLFADIGTGAGLGMGMSISWGIINAVQNMGMRIQQTISGIVSNGFAAVMETEMRKMTMRSFITQELADVTKEDKRTPNYGEMWEEAGKQAEDYYKQVVEIAKLSSYSRKPLLDLFQNMQVGGLTADNAAAVTRAVTMFGDAFMPGQKQMMDTFGQQVMQMMNQGVMQQVDLKLLATQGIPVYDFLAQNLPELQGKSKKDAQSEIFEMISKGQLGAVQGLEAIVKGMVDAAENFKGKAATTFTGLISTFQDLMLEKSEAIMQPVAENMFKPFVEFANDFLQSNAVTKGIEEFGKQILQVSQVITNSLATALGVIYGLWSNLPDPIKETIKALAEAVAIMGTLSIAIGVLAVVGAWLAPVFGAISGGVVAATAAIGAFVAAYTNNLFGFQTFLNNFAQNTIDFFLTWGQRLAQGILDGVGQAATALAGVINNFGANFMANMEAIYTGIYNFGQNAGAAIGAGFAQIQTWVGQAIDWLWALPTNVDEIVGWLGQAWNDMIATMTTWGQSVLTIIQETLTGLWEFPKGLDEIGAAVWQWGANIVQIFAGGMQSAIDVVGQALQAIGDMFSDWLEPHSPPKLLPDLDKWGTAAADIYLEGWTKADFGVMNDLSSKLEEALALDEGTLKEWETEAIRMGVADMVSKATQGIADSGQIMVAVPGWGGRAESVKRLADAYANLAVSQHKLTIEQEKLDAITAKYDAILKPLEARLNSIRNKQEALDLTDQIREYQNVLDNVYATDKQKAAAKLKMDELKLTQQINNTEMERDALTDPINERISALTTENNLNQDALDLAVERWNVEVAMLKAGQKKEGAAGSDAEKAAKDKADNEKNRQFTQPVLNVPKFDAKKSLGAIGSKMQGIADSMSKYFGKMKTAVQPLLDALQGIADKAKIVDDAIQQGMLMKEYTTEGGFIGFLNNVGLAIAQTKAAIDDAMLAWNNFTGAIGASWQFGDPNAGVMPGPQEQGMFGPADRPLSLSDLTPTTGAETNEKGFGGWSSASGKKPQIIGGGYISKAAAQWNEQATIVERVAQVKAVVETNLSTTLAAAGKALSDLATQIKTAFDGVDWVTIGTNISTGLSGTTKTLTDWAASLPDKIASALGGVLPEGGENKNPAALASDTADSAAEVGGWAGKAATNIVESIGRAIGMAAQSDLVDFSKIAEFSAGAVVIFTNTLIALLNAVTNFKPGENGFDEAVLGAAKNAGELITGVVLGTLFGAVIEAMNGDKVATAVATAKQSLIDLMADLLVDFMLGLGMGLAQPLIDGYNSLAQWLSTTTGGMVSPRVVTPEMQAESTKEFTAGMKGGYDLLQSGTQGIRQATSMGPMGVPFALASGGRQLGESIGSVWDFIDQSSGKTIQGAQTAAEAAATSLATAWPSAMTKAKAGESAWNTFTADFSTAATTKAATDPGIKTVGDAIGAGIVAGIGGHFGEAGAALNLANTALLTKFAELWGIQSPSTVSRDKIGVPIGQGIIEGINSVLGGSSGAAGAGATAGAAAGAAAGGSAQTGIDSMFAGILASMSAFSLNMQVAWLNMKTAITGILTTLSEEWQGIFDVFYEDANTKFDEWTVNWIEERVPAFGEALIELATSFKDGFLQVMDETIQGLNERLQQMIDNMSGMQETFYNAGLNLANALVGGIVEGMESEDATSRFSDMADAVIATILRLLKGAAESASPSKLMRDEVGFNLSAGIAEGMVMPSANKLLEDSSGNVIQQIVRNFQQGNGAQTVTSHVLRQPEQNMVSQNGATRNYILNLSVTPEMAERVNYNFGILETMAG